MIVTFLEVTIYILINNMISFSEDIVCIVVINCNKSAIYHMNVAQSVCVRVTSVRS